MKCLFIVTAIISMLFSKSYPQCDNEELIQEYISSSMPEERAYGCNLISQCQLYNFRDVLNEIFENESYVYPATAQLSALESLGFENISSLAEQFLERIDEMNLDTYVDVLESKVIATRILIRYDNFSSFDFLTQIVDRDKPNLSFETVYCLLQVLATGTQHIVYARDELINLVLNADEYLLRAVIIKELAKHPDEEVTAMLINIVQNDPDWSLRNVASNIILTDYYNTQQELLRSLTSSDPDKTNRLTLSKELLSKWGLPADLFNIEENLQNEIDPDVITGLTYIIQNFIPPNQAFPSLDARILNLFSYTDDLYEYEWITEEETYNYYQEKLYGLREAIENGYDEEACTIINEDLLVKIDQDEQEGIITTEGYKFLHYHTVYIKEIFEEEIGACK